jgi:transposase InsO family protein
VSERFEFIDAEKANYPVVKMCAWLEVSASGYYEWRDAPASATAQRREYLKLLITRAFDDSHQTYGYRRVHEQLARWGEQASCELVRALMRELGLRPCQPRPYRPVTTLADAAAAATPDLVRRDFSAAAPGVKLVGDITYIDTWEGWLYLATVIDCHTKAVVGWAMADHMKATLVCNALDMAAGNTDIADGCIFHSDRGTQYTSAEFRAKLASHRIRPSVGRTGVCWDNAMAESFFAAIKNEWLNRTVYATRDQARREVVKYIEGFYNRRRLHSGLGYRTPQEVHDEYLNRQVAA